MNEFEEADRRRGAAIRVQRALEERRRKTTYWEGFWLGVTAGATAVAVISGVVNLLTR